MTVCHTSDKHIRGDAILSRGLGFFSQMSSVSLSESY